MAYTYDRSPSGDTLHITRCDEGHLQLIVSSGIGSATVPVCIDTADLPEVMDEMVRWARDTLGRDPLADGTTER